MRGLRTFIALVVVLVGLGAYLYFVESKREPGDSEKLAKVFTGLEAGKIDHVTVTSDSGEKTALEKKNGTWRITTPITADADEAAVSGLTTNLASLEIQRVVDEKPTDVKQYGLEKPHTQVAFTADGKDHTLLVGGKTPTGTDLYAQVNGEPRVFLVSSYLDSTFNKSTFDLRDKSILKLDRDAVDRLTIATPDHQVALAKKGSEWQLTTPVTARADFTTVEGLIGRLNTTQMKAITAQDATDLKPYGLDKPQVTVRTGAGSAEAALAIGKSAGEGAVYAKDLSRPMVFTVDSTLADDLKKPAGDFRIKDLFDARSFNTTRVEVTRGGKTFAFEKSNDKWKQTSPSAKDADTAKVDALVSALTNARADSFVESAAGTGLDTPELTATVTSGDNHAKETVSFARRGKDAFAARAGDPGAAKIDSSTLDAVIKALEALQ